MNSESVLVTSNGSCIVESQAVSTRAQRLAALNGSLSSSPPVRVLCVDDHRLFVEGLKVQFAFDAEVTCIGYLSSATNLLEEIVRLKPDVVLLDIEMPGPDVFEMADRAQHTHPQTRIIFLSAHQRQSYLTAAYKCGAWGYCTKGEDATDIVNCVKSVARCRERTFITSPSLRHSADLAGPRVRFSRASAHGRDLAEPRTSLDALTAREIEVLRLIGKGQSRKEIAREISRSVKTVDGHQDHIMKKLNIDSRSQLVRFAIREGLAQP